MKFVKRIIAIVLLIVTVLVIGYLVFTGSRLTATDNFKNENLLQAEVSYEKSKNI